MDQPLLQRHDDSHSKARVWDLVRQLLVTMTGAALAIVAVFWFQPWDLVLAVKDRLLGAFSVAFSAAYLCVFASGVLVGSFFIPVIMAFAPHMFMDMAQTDRKNWRRRQADIASSHNFVPVWAEKGAMGGVVWTAPGSRWGGAQTLVGPWPPATQGKNAKFLKWTVFVRDGFLIMRQDNRNEARSNADGAHRNVPVDARVPLAGARVDLLPEATKDKSPWLRKAPLKIIFPEPRHPYAEDSLVMFASTSAEKEQWHLALTWAAHFFEPAPVAPGMHTLGLQVQDLYHRFSLYIRGTSPVILPMALNQETAVPVLSALPASGNGGAMGEDGAPARGNPNRGWFGRGRRRPRPPGAVSTAVPQRKTQVVGDFIQDKQWGGQPSQQGKQGTKSQDSASRSSKGVLTAARPHSSSNLAQLATMPSLQQLNSGVHMEPQSPASASAGGYAMPSPQGDGSAAECAGDVLAAVGYTQPIMQHADHASPTMRVHSQSFAGAGDAGSLSGSTELRADCAQPGLGVPPALHVGHGVGQLAGLHAVNMFITRCGFDLLRSQKFYDSLRQRLTVRLANILVPNYITPLRLDGMELGTTTPMIKSAHALPSPSKTLVPRLVLDIVYSGSFKLIIQTSINMKESPADFSTAFMAAAGSSMDMADGSAIPLDLAGPSQGSPPPELPADALDEEALKVLQEGFDTLTSAGGDVTASSKNGRSEGGGSASTSVSAPLPDSSVPDSKASKKPGFAARVYRSTKNIMTGSVRRVVDSIVESVARTSVTLEVVFTHFEGPIMVWLAPPPSNRLWISFLQQPKIKVTAKPLNVNAMVQYTAMGVKLSSWLEGKLKQSISKNMVFPACTDIKIPFLLNEEDLESIAMPLHVPAVPLERTSSPGPLSPTRPGAYHASTSSLSSTDAASDLNNGNSSGDRTSRSSQGKLHAKQQRQKTKERAKHSTPKAPAGQRGTAGEAAAAAITSAPGSRLADVTSSAARRPFMRVFTHAIPRILRRGGQPQSIGASTPPPLLTASPTSAEGASSSTQQMPAAIILPEGRTLSSSFSRRSATQASSTSGPSLTERSSSSNNHNLSDVLPGAPVIAAEAATEIGLTSPPADVSQSSLGAATEIDDCRDGTEVSTVHQSCSQPGNLDTEQHPANSSALSVSPSSPVLSQNTPSVPAHVRVMHAHGVLNSAEVRDEFSAHQDSTRRRQPAEAEPQLMYTSVACADVLSAPPAMPEDGQDAVFDSDALPSAATPNGTPTSRKSPGANAADAAAVQRLVSSVFAAHCDGSDAGPAAGACSSNPPKRSASSSGCTLDVSHHQSLKGISDGADVASACSPSPLQSRAASSHTATTALLSAHIAEASATPVSAASESGTEALSTTGTPSEYPSEGHDGSPILQAHHEQAALLHLHMMGKKKKKMKAGSYVIGDDGSVMRGKRPPAR